MRNVLALVPAICFLGVLTNAQADSALRMRNPKNGEQARIFVGHLGQIAPIAWRRANRFMRSWRKKAQRPMHPRLLRTLRHIQKHFRGKPIQLSSGYRVADTPGRPSSYHSVGRAADIWIDGVGKRRLFNFCRSLPNVGCGFYPRSRHVHVDIRGQSSVWVDLAGPGETPRYVDTPRRWLRRNRAAQN